MHRFYAEDIERTLTLPEDESRHATRVLRLSEGDEIEVVDGKGALLRCRLTLAHTKRAMVEIEARETIAPHWGAGIHIAIAPTKNLDRLEWMAEKCTEMGVDSITPLLCAHSERRVLKTERLHKILVAAMKQSLKATLPHLDELTPIESVLRRPFNGKKYLAYCDPELPRDKRLDFSREYDPSEPALIMIGPEGDFSPEEVAAALDAGFRPVTLGESRLRTETAAVYACAACHSLKRCKM